MKNYTLKERLIILHETTKYVNNDMELTKKLKNGVKNEHGMNIIRQLRTYNELDCRTDGALICQISSVIVAKWYNDGRKWSKNGTCQKYVEILEMLEKEF
jgi:hypothetical protein